MISATFDSTKTPLQELRGDPLWPLLAGGPETPLQGIEADTGKVIARGSELFRI
jgi:hypothetical protein